MLNRNGNGINELGAEHYMAQAIAEHVAVPSATGSGQLAHRRLGRALAWCSVVAAALDAAPVTKGKKAARLSPAR